MNIENLWFHYQSKTLHIYIYTFIHITYLYKKKYSIKINIWVSVISSSRSNISQSNRLIRLLTKHSKSNQYHTILYYTILERNEWIYHFDYSRRYSTLRNNKVKASSFAQSPRLIRKTTYPTDNYSNQSIPLVTQQLPSKPLYPRTLPLPSLQN